MKSLLEPAEPTAGIKRRKKGRAPQSRASVTDNRGVKVVYSVTVNRSAADLYHFWRDLQNLPKFMRHLKSVQVNDAKISHWTARGPLGKTIEWDAEIINEKENQMVAWRSCPGADVDNAGSVRFKPAPDGRGAEVTVSLEYVPPAGALGKIIAKLYGEEPGQQVADDLRRFKAVMETGEIPTVEGQPMGA